MSLSLRFRTAVSVTLLFLACLLLAGSQEGPPAASASQDAIGQVWSDVDCNGSADPGDVVPMLRLLADVERANPPCPLAGAPVSVTDSELQQTLTWGDADCDGDADMDDVFAILLQDFAAQVAGALCPASGEDLDLITNPQTFEEPASWRDYGDAPDGTETGYTSGAETGNFPSTPANAGPAHASPYTVWLGEFETVEPGPSTIGDDADDGLLGVDVPDCGEGSLLVLVNFGGLTQEQREEPLYLNILADWNRDGEWSGADTCADEWTVRNQQLSIAEASDETVMDTFVVPFDTGVQAQELWLRVSLTRSAYNPEVGGDLAGETEDYLVTGGQIFHEPVLSEPLAEPQGVREGQPDDFYCKSRVIPHGGLFGGVVFVIEQTVASKESGFKTKSLKVQVGQPKKADGTAGGGTFDLADPDGLKREDAGGGRERITITGYIETTSDPPERIEGPFTLALAMEGTDTKGKAFKGTVNCRFYIDHSADGIERDVTAEDQAKDGFTGFPGHTDAREGVNEIHHIIIQHGGKTKIRSDGQGAGKYDPASLKVYGPDGKPVALGDPPKKPKDPPQAGGAGIRKVTPAANGRAIEVETVKDEPTPRVEVIIIRVKGKFANNQEFIDYYRIVIVHGKKGQEEQAQKLLDQIAYAPPGIDMLHEDQSFAVAYAAGAFSTEFVSQIVPDEQDEEWPREVICLAASGTNFQAIMHGSTHYVVGYSGGGTDLYSFEEPEEEQQLSGQLVAGVCPNGDINVTDRGAGNPYFLERGAVCDGWYYGGQFEQTGFKLVRIDTMTGEILDVPGGESHRYGGCARDRNGMHILTASTPLNNSAESGPRIGRFLPCGGLCQQGGSGVFSDLNIPLGAGVHIQHMVISPDLTMIAYTRTDLTSSQIWVADFDQDTLTTSNWRQLTSDGGNATPAWSPDSKRIAFVSNRGGLNDVWVVNADGTGEMNLSNTPDVPEFVPSWQKP